MRYQAQIPLHQNISCLQVSLGGQRQKLLFLLLGQRLGEAAGMKLERIKQAAQQQPDVCKHLLHLSTTLFSISHGYSDGDRPQAALMIREFPGEIHAIFVTFDPNVLPPAQVTLWFRAPASEEEEYAQTGCFAAICKETLFAFAVSGKECGSFTM